MLTEDALEALPEVIVSRLEWLNTYTLKLLCGRIKRIGTVLPSDLHKINQLEMYSTDMNLFYSELARVTEKNVSEITNILELVAQDAVSSCKDFFIKSENANKFVPYAENTSLKQWVSALAKQTQDTYLNLSQTKALGFVNIDEYGKKQAVQFETAYSEIIDKAITAVSSGVTDYNSEMQSIIGQLADSGIRHIEYESGYTRRLDSSVRQNIQWGIKQCNDGVQEQLGEEFDADGYEISYHNFPRPSHEAMGGEQFAIGTGKTVNGKFYPSFEENAEPLLKDYNCYHRKFPIICGISPPSYSSEQLAKLKAKDHDTIEFDGKTYTGYEAKQMQRKLERTIRNAKDRHIAFNAVGNMEALAKEQERIDILAKKYKQFSAASGLSVKADRLKVVGYERKRKAELLTEEKKNGIIKILPKVEKVVIDPNKFTNYALNPSKDINKATAFKEALGYDLNNTDLLIKNIRENILNFPSKEKADNGYGKRYEVLMTLIGENGKKANVKTAWIDDKETGEMRLTSAYVTQKSVKEE